MFLFLQHWAAAFQIFKVQVTCDLFLFGFTKVRPSSFFFFFGGGGAGVFQSKS